MTAKKPRTILVLTPATLRPDIYQRTLGSFFGRCFNHDICFGGDNKIDYKLALHLDCVGGRDFGETNAGHGVMGILRQAEMFFGARKIWYYEAEQDKRFCSLSRSFHKLFNFGVSCDADYFFYLEDDWILHQHIYMQKMIKIMDDNPNLATLRLNRFCSDLSFTKQWKHKFPWTGEFFKCPEKDKPYIGWCGHPGLVRPEFIRETLPFLKNNECPERQIKGIYGPTKMRKIVLKWDYGVYGFPGSGPCISDIGRVWRSQKNIIKLKDTTWRMKKKGTE
jgi:hypothetical protein